MSGQQQPETAQDVFRDASFGSGPASSSSSAQFQPETAQSIFAGAGGSTAASNPDLSHLHPIAKMSSQELDYIALEDDRLNELEGTKGVLPSRGALSLGLQRQSQKMFNQWIVFCRVGRRALLRHWQHIPCRLAISFRPGVSPLSAHWAFVLVAGLAAGGVWGFRDGLFRPVYNSKASLGALSAQQAAVQNATAPGTGEAAAAATAASGKPQPLRLGTPFRLRLNTVLNAVTSRGTFVGNNAGVLGEFNFSAFVPIEKRADSGML